MISPRSNRKLIANNQRQVPKEPVIRQCDTHDKAATDNKKPELSVPKTWRGEQPKAKETGAATKLLAPGIKYHQITFGGCGFLLPYYFGAVLCMMDNDITVEHAVGISGGAMAALAILRGSNLYVGIRQAIVDLVAECGGLLLCGLNPLFMNFYFKYMWNFRCAVTNNRQEKQDNALNQEWQQGRSSDKGNGPTPLFELHDMSAETRLDADSLSGRYHVLMLSISGLGEVGGDTWRRMLGIDEVPALTPKSPEEILEAEEEDEGTFLNSVVKHEALTDWQCDEDIVRAACICGGIAGVTTFWPRTCRGTGGVCLDRLSTSHRLSIIKQVPNKNFHSIRIAVTPVMFDPLLMKDADVRITGGFTNPFPIFNQARRKEAFVRGYMDMQRNVRGCKVLDPSRAIEYHAPFEDESSTSWEVDAEETIQELLDFILFGSDAAHWKDPFALSRVVDGEHVPPLCPQSHRRFSEAIDRRHLGLSVAVAALLASLVAMQQQKLVLWCGLIYFTLVMGSLVIHAIGITVLNTTTSNTKRKKRV